jgi:hypothetical protein
MPYSDMRTGYSHYPPAYSNPGIHSKLLISKIQAQTLKPRNGSKRGAFRGLLRFTYFFNAS